MTRKFKGQSLFAFPSDYTVVDIETVGFINEEKLSRIISLRTFNADTSIISQVPDISPRLY